MKTKIIYTLIFIGAFILTTAVLVFLNTQFNNIFKFDFSAPEQTITQEPRLTSTGQDQQVKTDSTNSLITKNVKNNDTKILEDDRLKDEMESNQKLQDSLSTLLKVIDEMKQQETKPVEQVVNNTIEEVSETEKAGYEDWVKKTSNLYASMDSKKAAKIIQNYSDNIARDILYSMNRKKAAEILAEFKPEIATRIMSLN